MFSRNSKGSATAPTPAVPSSKTAPSIISVDMRIVGDLASQGEMQIDGTVEGDIRTRSLLVGETADVKGEILADTVQVHGRITGQIKARSVHLAKKAHVVGDILHEKLSIEPGAFLEGHCRRMPERRENETPEGTAVVFTKPGGFTTKFLGEPKKVASSG